MKTTFGYDMDELQSPCFALDITSVLDSNIIKNFTNGPLRALRARIGTGPDDSLVTLASTGKMTTCLINNRPETKPCLI